MPPFKLNIPKGHKIINIKITQENGPIDKTKALEKIIQTKLYTEEIINALKYHGTTSKFHIFSYPALT